MASFTLEGKFMIIYTIVILSLWTFHSLHFSCLNLLNRGFRQKTFKMNYGYQVKILGVKL